MRNAEHHVGSASSLESGAFSTLANVLRGPGTGAPSSRRHLPIAIALAAFACLLALSAQSASAALTRTSLGQFGGPGGPTFSRLGGLAVDQTTGDVYAYDSGAEAVLKFDSAGTPANFSGLGTNQITGVAGAGAGENEIAVDTSSGETAGDIYVATNTSLLIFGPEGSPRGELAGEEPCGVAVDSAGNVYVGRYGETVDRYTAAPGEDAPSDADRSPAPLRAPIGICNVGVQGDGASVYAATYNGGLHKYPADQFGEPEAAGSELDPAANTLAVDPDSDHVFADESSQVAEFDGAGNAGATFGSGELSGSVGIAVNSADDEIYVADGETIKVFGSTIVIPGVSSGPATNNSGTKGTLNGSVNPASLPVTECKFEYGLTTTYSMSKPCVGAIPTDGNDHQVSASLTGLTPNGVTYHFRISATNANGTNVGVDETFVTAHTVITGAVSAVSETAATLNGSVNPDGESLTACEFEYGPTVSYGSTVPCSPDFSSISGDASSQAVTASLTGLPPETEYHFRLVAADTNGEIDGDDETFRTGGHVMVGDPTATTTDPSGTKAGLYGFVNPNGEANYRFEYGTTTDYGNSLPVPEGSVGPGAEPTAVSQFLSGLQPGTLYHFRLRAKNATTEAVSLDETFKTPSPGETGLPDDRAFELVSPPDKQPAGSVSVANVGNLNYQAAVDGESVGYTILNGLKDSTAGGEVIYVGQRGPDGWRSAQASPPSLVPSATDTASSRFDYFSPDIGCGFVQTPSPLTADVPQFDKDHQTVNLYRRSGDGSFTLVSNLPPINPTASDLFGTYFIVAGAAPNCGRVYFKSEYQMIPGASGLYEWDEGTLRDAAIRPDGSTAPPISLAAESSPRLGDYNNSRGTYLNTVSEDGSRFIFTSTSDEGADSGQQAVFMRENGTSTIDVSVPTSATPSLGARYELASPDGSHVFFAANLGLAGPAGVGPQESCTDERAGPGGTAACDLYDYDVEQHTLTDLTTDANPADSSGAALQGVVGVSSSGSRVYFAAKGQLLPEQGRTFAQNVSAESANIYLAHAGRLDYVTSLTDGDLRGSFAETRPGGGAKAGGGSLAREPQSLTARVDSSGSHLLFESRSNIAGYESSGASEAYLYSAETNQLSCVSCRSDAGVPLMESENENRVLRGVTGALEVSFHYARSLSDDGSRVFFKSEDALAPGAIEGKENIYQWENGTVSLLADEGQFDDASVSGADVFVSTAQKLDPHDVDNELDLYDMRVGGGFPPPPPPSTSCDPIAGQCQGPETSAPGAPDVSSQGFTGPGNPKPKPRKKHKKHHHKKKRHKARHKKKNARKHHNPGGSK